MKPFPKSPVSPRKHHNCANVPKTFARPSRFFAPLREIRNQQPYNKETTMDLLQIDQLSKTYPNGVKALDSVTLTIPHGMYGLLGPNGAGKSTLMRTLATLQDSDSGSVTFGTLDVLHDKEEVRKRLGYLPQDFGVYPKISAVDMLDHLA